MRTFKHVMTAMLLSTVAHTIQAQEKMQTGIDKSNMDLTTQASDDFYQYACGG